MMRLLASALRVAEIQFQIFLTRAKITALRIGVFVVLGVAAILLALLAVIFLYIGAFRVLTDVVHLAPVWAYLIFGGLHLVLAAALGLIAVKYIAGKDAATGEEEHKLPATADARVKEEAR